MSNFRGLSPKSFLPHSIAVHAGLRRLIQFHRYPAYIVDLLVVPLFIAGSRRRGLVVGSNCSFRGLPLISLYPESRIIVHDRAFLISRSSDTAMGVSHPIILRTLRRGASITIHEGCRASGTTICAATTIVIGENVVIGSNATIVDTDFHALDPGVRSSIHDAEMAQARPVNIGANTFVGAGATILKGVTVGNSAIVGAGAVVTRDVPAGAVVAGNPAKVVGSVQNYVYPLDGRAPGFSIGT
jgi:acetyltransferase-like isoleucine patch superfamily enzyme